jgi:uncharacterized membrane protein
MWLDIIPIAEASAESLVRGINRVIINPIIYFLFVLAFVYFLWGVLQYLLYPDNEEIRKKSKTHMLWGIIGLFIMVAVFGIMRILLNTLGEKRIQIQNDGNYTIDKNR